MIGRVLLFCIPLFASGVAAGGSFAAESAPAAAASPVAATAAAPEVAKTFKDCGDCPEMIVVPAGNFRMGSPQEVLNDNEGPPHAVSIRKAFAVGIYDITFDQWGSCVAGGGCNSYVPPDQEWGRGTRPVIYVNWHDAQAYVRWLNATVRSLQPVVEGAPVSADTAGPYRLLTEAEWEYAARAGSTTAYYWGDGRDKGKANCDGCGSEWDNKQTAPVGSFAPNKFGLYDMAGNVLQWVEDCFHDNYIGAPTDGSAWKAGKCEARVMRGGSYFNSTYYIRSSQRFVVSPHIRANNSSFRVAKTLE